jgi:hypothetical protein
MPITDLTQTVQTQTLELIDKAQAAVVDAVRTWAGAVEGFVPETPDLPLVDGLPKPAKVVDAGFELAEKLLESQRRFVRELFDAAAPVLGPAAEKAQPTVKPVSSTKAQKSA